MTIRKTELLAPAGNMQKLKAAVHFGADAVYLGGKNFGLRALTDNFTNEEIVEGLAYLHARGKKGYITCNIFAKNNDFAELEEYLDFLQEARADAVIVSDPGVLHLARKKYPELEIHLSTQANTTNKYSAKFWEQAGAQRIVLARELSLKEISEIRKYLSPTTELEAFVHGAMCISYSGRCLLSNYLNGRDSNRGQCIQACRWEYEIREQGRKGEYLTITEDNRGTYILNSRDLNLINHLTEMRDAGVYSFKVEGRMKSEYYISTVINAYRRAIDILEQGGTITNEITEELDKTAHREYTTAFADGANTKTENHLTSNAVSDYEFTANVLGYEEGRGIKVMQRNRFKQGDILEVLSPDENFNKKIEIKRMTAENGTEVTDAKLVQQILYIESDIKLNELDLLRRKKTE